MENSIYWLRWGSVLGCLAVIFGAFGSHYLKSRLSLAQLGSYQTAVHYQLVHAVVIIAIGVWTREFAHLWLQRANICFLLGVILFSGSIYLLLWLGPHKILGIMTPIGGSLMILGWLALFLTTFSK